MIAARADECEEGMLAVEREKQHRAMYKEAFEEFKTGLMKQMYTPN